jgi:hypothetical protein
MVADITVVGTMAAGTMLAVGTMDIIAAGARAGAQ